MCTYSRHSCPPPPPSPFQCAVRIGWRGDGCHGPSPHHWCGADARTRDGDMFTFRTPPPHHQDSANALLTNRRFGHHCSSVKSTRNPPPPPLLYTPLSIYIYVYIYIYVHI